MKWSYELLSEEYGFALWRATRGDSVKWSVTVIDRDKGQIYSCMPGDDPPGGGLWCAGITDFGVAYVAGRYSKSYATRKYRELVREAQAQELQEAWISENLECDDADFASGAERLERERLAKAWDNRKDDDL